jgi:hypothetical protein
VNGTALVSPALAANTDDTTIPTIAVATRPPTRDIV